MQEAPRLRSLVVGQRLSHVRVTTGVQLNPEQHDDHDNLQADHNDNRRQKHRVVTQGHTRAQEPPNKQSLLRVCSGVASRRIIWYVLQRVDQLIVTSYAYYHWHCP